jgi:hypothetical protein
LDDRVLPFFNGHEVKLLRLLAGRGINYSGNLERREYERYLAVEHEHHATRQSQLRLQSY